MGHEADKRCVSQCFSTRKERFPVFSLEMHVFYWLFEALFGWRENYVFYAYLEHLLGFREKHVFVENPSFAKVQCFTRFSLWTPFGDLLFLLFLKLWTQVNKNHLPKWAPE